MHPFFKSSLTLVFTIIFISLVPGCATTTPPPAAVVEPSPFASTDSLYSSDWLWQTDAGRPLRLSELRGKPQIIAMFFTTCTGTCGVTVSRMIQLDASLTPRQRNSVGFNLVTFDSNNDTPRSLAQYRSQRNLPADWNLLHGSPQATRELADDLGVPFSNDPVRHILHGAQITILDKNGRIVQRIIGVDSDLSSGLAAITAQLADAN